MSLTKDLACFAMSPKQVSDIFSTRKPFSRHKKTHGEI